MASKKDQIAALEEQLAAARNEAESEARKRREAEGHQRAWRQRHDALKMREAARVDAERAKQFADADRARRKAELKRIEQARDGLVHVDGADSVSFTQEDGQWFVTVERKINDAEAAALQKRVASKPTVFDRANEMTDELASAILREMSYAYTPQVVVNNGTHTVFHNPGW